MTIVEQITTWVNKSTNPKWWRFTIKRVLELGELSQPEYEEILQIAKMEFGIIEQSSDYETKVSAVKPIGFGAEESAYSLSSISRVSNVSSLASDQRLEFNSSGITVVYGDNGVGKSSYAKILKNACLTRGEAPDVIPNVFTGATGTPTAVIEVESGNTIYPLTWIKNAEPHDKLKSIRIFDSHSSTHYLSKSDSIDYKPSALKLLDELNNAASYINRQCSSDLVNLQSSLALPEMNSDTAASKFIKSICSKTTNAQIEAHCAADHEAEVLKSTKLDHHELSTNTPEVLRNKYQNQRKSLESFRDFLQTLDNKLGDKAVERYKQLHQHSVSTRQASNRMGEETFTGLPFEKIGSHEWQVMWSAVESFVKNTRPDGKFPPQNGGTCPTCLQTIGEESATRLESFNQYLKNEIHSKATQADNAYKNSQTRLKNVSTNLEPYLSVLNLVGGFNSELRNKLDTLVEAFTSRKNTIISKNPDFNFTALDLGPLEWFNAQIKSLRDKEAGVKDNEAQAKTIANKLKAIQETEDRLKVHEYKQAILDDVQKSRLRDKYNNLSGTTGSNAITRKSTEISTSGSIGQIQSYFVEELKILGFKNFKVETATKGSKGKQMLSLKISGNRSKLIDIASEGEQKCISLAGFIAELRVDNRKSAIIFDDPVNSLDHKYREKFAKRICTESQHRQVIILTHDLPFLMMLQEIADSINVLALTRNPTTTGLLLERPPWDSLKTAQRIADLKNRLPSLKRLYNENEEAYRVQARTTYLDMRKAWERLIEEWLIKGVVERFGRGVKPTNARYLVDTQQEDVDTINAAMDKCSRCCHDTASELGATYPDVDELERDIFSFDDYFKRLKKRRNASS